MNTIEQWITPSILVITYIGDVLFAMSGALTAGRYRMDLIGYLMIGTITGIGGGTLRDLLLGRSVWWTTNPLELILCLTASVFTFFFIRDLSKLHKVVTWLDALGLSAFAVTGCHIATYYGSPFVVAVFMGMMTATGGGMIRDVLTGTKPMILSAGELYATAALGGAFVYATILNLSGLESLAELLGFTTVLSLRSASILFGVQMGPPDEFLRRIKANTSAAER